MTSPLRSLIVLGLAAASALALAGCASSTLAGDGADGGVSVVASTNVYGQIAEQIGGDLVEVTSIVSNESQDPHSFEPSARDQLAVAKADLIIENGGGYDAFIDALIESSGAGAPVLTAVEFSDQWPGGAAHDDSDDSDHADEDGDHGHEHIEGFNEHVWYDPHAMADLALGVAAQLEALSPADADVFAANAEAFVAEVEGLEASLADIAATHAGAEAFVTEPVPAYLIAAAGLENVTPDAFTEAVEEGQDVAPATLLESIARFEDGDVKLVVTNTQTAGAETAQIVGEADGRGIPSMAFSETLPEGQTYISWMQANIEALSGALES
ncbi:zinc ABC transporter substrate-binding protein [Microbacterium sp. CFH 31415]|uniref:metal ABC transporter solute-binding protein, Zn/Mn family n=1 Tax=Microbacterium sp. CFH 31415 TaxID=2921732 RepID=UPI001F144CDB|nr:zinc ABC transporter substrate-binding protein [Microbacterium sp. CFH 31415]MCH6230466.1 zinc ABC transporter substrate-binding protein [Microbacterium sp. CFH 31415]